ncbi:unnamed protein product, partial [Penicillium nalgiovense]
PPGSLNIVFWWVVFFFCVFFSFGKGLFQFFFFFFFFPFLLALGLFIPFEMLSFFIPWSLFFGAHLCLRSVFMK